MKVQRRISTVLHDFFNIFQHLMDDALAYLLKRIIPKIVSDRVVFFSIKL